MVASRDNLRDDINVITDKVMKSKEPNPDFKKYAMRTIGISSKHLPKMADECYLSLFSLFA